ncbi:GNAT family N-acetyltransferase [Streptomyces sp. NBC_00320]|uniref:GNAT family N-acetyltransferase n=1 Tax=Streptomyces sp. NBC_00320 TaxID=2975711 RepID=UPI00224E9F8E|nr:GNAT family N-acetyltransferase [Streptomyces sp. NBC_00320]MCX5149083.1 GNAT family N-acetyltransferase [Streptomyces sp. NBC_00320]
MTAQQPLDFAQITRPRELTAELREQLVDCWIRVINAGGAVIPRGLPMPPVSTGQADPALGLLVGELDPRRARMLIATAGGRLAGWLILRRDPHPLVAHCGAVNHVMTHPDFRGRGIGTALMHRVRDLARQEMGLEQLHIAVRAGLGLEEFYGRLGWREIGRWPGGLRVAPGDDRDEILMYLALPAA